MLCDVHQIVAFYSVFLSFVYLIVSDLVGFRRKVAEVSTDAVDPRRD